jgi:hypothetical protein
VPRTFLPEIVCAYDNSTLMIMALDPEIDYAGLDDWVECMAAQFAGKKDYPVRRYRQFPIQSVDGISVRKRPPASPHEVMSRLAHDLISHPASKPFRLPLSEDMHPTYRMVIEEPINLGMIENQVAQHSYRKIDGFLHDLNRMLSNYMHFFQKE